MDKQEYRELQQFAANGGTKYFGRLYETIYREMYYTAFYSLADDADAVEAVISAIRSGFSAIGRLHSERAFRLFMMKHLCSSIKVKFKEYAAEGRELRYNENELRPNADGIDIKQEFNILPDTERLVCALYVGGKFRAEEIAQFTGMPAGAVKKNLSRALAAFELD